MALFWGEKCGGIRSPSGRATESFNSVEWLLYRVWSDFCKDLLLVGTWNRACFLEQPFLSCVLGYIRTLGLGVRNYLQWYLSNYKQLPTTKITFSPILGCLNSKFWIKYIDSVHQSCNNLILICISVRPENVRILSKREPLSAGRDFLLECKSHGSRPPATITWWKNSKFLNNAESQV